MSSVSVVIPVKDGGALLERVLGAVRAQGEVELLVIDSGSRDGSREVARAAGAELIEIPPEDFGHGRTRNLGAERASGELIAFLTQDAVPVDGLARCDARGVHAHGSRGSRLRPTSPPGRHQPDDRPRADRVLRRVLAQRHAGDPPAWGPRLPVERERLLRPRVLGGGSLPGRALRRGPGIRPRHAGGRLGEGLPPRRGGAARARLRAGRVHEALLRRVPRAS